MASAPDILSNIRNTDFRIITTKTTGNTTMPLNTNVFSTLLNASSFSGSIVDWLMSSNDLPPLPFSIGSNALLSNDKITAYIPYILDHQYRIIHEQQLQISALAEIIAEQQKVLPQISKTLLQHDTLLAKHSILLSNTKA